MLLRHPRSICLSLSKLKSRLLLLNNSLYNDSDADNNTKPVENCHKIKSIIVKMPGLLAYDSALLQRKIDAITDALHLSKSEVRSIITNYPQALTHDIESGTIPMIRAVQSALDLSQDQVRNVFVKCPSLFGYSIELVVSKCVCFVDDMGFTSDQVSEIVARQPVVLSLSMENNVKPKVAYLLNVLSRGSDKTRNGLYAEIKDDPIVLLLSLHEKIVPRVLYWEQSVSGRAVEIAELASISNKTFCRKVAQECERLDELDVVVEELEEVAERYKKSPYHSDHDLFRIRRKESEK